MKLLIKNGRLINPKTNVDAHMDVLIADKKIATIAEKIECDEATVIDAKGCWVVPGLIDVHVHLREPGFEHKETIKTGSQAAARGGFTTICAMPNTNPVTDSEIIVDYIKNKAKAEALVNIEVIGAMTKGQNGEELANIGLMKQAGICALSEDGKSVLNPTLMKKAMTYGKMFDLPVLAHCEEPSLAGSGVMHSGDVSTLIGLKGIPREAEDIIVARDILLSKATGARLHVCHISTEDSVELVRKAKVKGINVTAEVAPHHFTLTDEAVMDYDTNTKMNPPLRDQRDIEAIKKGLADGTIDMIATDHAPHHIDDKNCEFDKAANGIVGLETSVALGITELVEKTILTPMEWVEKMSYNPAKLLKIKKGNIEIGYEADVTIINPNSTYTIDKNEFVSKGKNTPFHGKKVKGKVTHTIVSGKIVYQTKSEVEK